MKLPKKPDSRLSYLQVEAWWEMHAVLSIQSIADNRYNDLDNSEKGKVVSTDLARNLDKRYQVEPPEGEVRDLKPGWDLAWRYAQDRLKREIQNRGRRHRVRFMAGGWAAGKSHALRHEESIPDLVWDGTLQDDMWTAGMVDLALQNGWKVEVAYIYRNLELSFYGALEREKTDKRSVPLDKLPAVHRAVQQSILRLAELYRGKSGISFLFIHNLGKKGAMVNPLNIELKDLALNGSLHYLERHEGYYKSAAKHIRDNHDA